MELIHLKIDKANKKTALQIDGGTVYTNFLPLPLQYTCAQGAKI